MTKPLVGREGVASPLFKFKIPSVANKKKTKTPNFFFSRRRAAADSTKLCLKIEDIRIQGHLHKGGDGARCTMAKIGGFCDNNDAFARV